MQHIQYISFILFGFGGSVKLYFVKMTLFMYEMFKTTLDEYEQRDFSSLECELNVTTEEGIVTTLTWKSIEGDIIDFTKTFYIWRDVCHSL